MRSVESVAIGMATFRRPELLAALLPRVIDQIEQAAMVLDPAPRFRVIVVDNDPDASGRDAAAALDDPRITYVVESRPGISSARNRLLDEAAGSDVLILLDDDETPHDGWLVHHLSTFCELAADAVCGPVHAVFEGREDPWIAASGYYLGQRRTGVRTGTVIRRAATNNLLLDMTRVRELGLRFDPRFGLTGGEDSLFTGQLTAAGGRIVVCAEAVVDDLVPAARNTRRFNLSRRFSQASSHVRVDRELAGSLHGSLGVTTRWAVIGAGQILKGLILAGFGRATRDLGRLSPGESRVASGLGVLAGCLGIRPTSYGRPRRLGRRR